MAYGTIVRNGLVTVRRGSVVVTGSGTTWASGPMALKAGDDFRLAGLSELLAQVVSDTEFHLELPWSGEDADDVEYLVRLSAPARSTTAAIATSLAEANTSLQYISQYTLNLPCIAFDVNAPPDFPAPKDTYLIGDAPTGAWASRAQELAMWTGGTWFIRPGQPCDSIISAATGDIRVMNEDGQWAPMGLSLDTGPDRVAVQEMRVEVATDLSATRAARDEAQAAVANPIVTYHTLLELNAHLGADGGTLGQVLEDGIATGLYLKSGGPGTGAWTWLSSVTLPALGQRVQGFEAAIDPGNAWPGLTVADEAGDWVFRLAPDGVVTMVRAIETNPDPAGKVATMWSTLAAFDLVSAVPGLTIVDANGDWLFHHDPASPFVAQEFRALAPVTVTATDFSAAEIEAMDSIAVGRVAAYRQGFDGDVIGPIWDINLTTVLNQSLGRSSEGWPSQLRDIPSSLGLRMLGDCELPASETSSTYDPLGASVFNPLVGRDYDNNGTRVLTQAEAAALPQGSGAAGASPSLCALWVKRQMYLRRAMTTDDGRQWLLTVPGVGGQTMAEFLPATPGTYWPRYPDMLTKVQSAATALGKSVGLTTLHISQGQADSTAGTSKADFKAGRESFMEAMRAQLATTFGQTEPFAMIEIQPGGPVWGRDNLYIQDAVLELAAENPHYVVATPHHHVPNKVSGHLSVNGYMWLGCKLGQVDFETTILRRPWPAARLMEARHRGRTVLASFWMPYPGIQFRNCYMAGTPTMLLHKGISLFDSAGQVAIATNTDGSSTVSVAGLLTLKLTTTRDIVGPLTVKIADKSNSQGIANIFDSDPFVAPLSHIYDPAAGMYGPDNIPELTGKPYPMFNACNACQIVASAA